MAILLISVMLFAAATAAPEISLKTTNGDNSVRLMLDRCSNTWYSASMDGSSIQSVKCFFAVKFNQLQRCHRHQIAVVSNAQPEDNRKVDFMLPATIEMKLKSEESGKISYFLSKEVRCSGHLKAEVEFSLVGITEDGALVNEDLSFEDMLHEEWRTFTMKFDPTTTYFLSATVKATGIVLKQSFTSNAIKPMA